MMPAFSAVIYVKAGATGNNSGTSWANAHPDLESAFNRSQLVDEIWVAAGTYKPGGANPTRASSFRIGFAGVPIYGGFAGTETAVNQRNPAANVTILSGEIGNPNSVADNTYHVVTFSQLFGPPILDGFTITGGNANGTGNDAFGGGMRVDFSGGTYRNLIFRNNRATRGGGLAYRTDTSLNFDALTFDSNSATEYGGAVYTPVNATITFNRSLFYTNAAGLAGGAFANPNAQLVLNDCILQRNSTAGYGGAMDVGATDVNASPRAKVERCLFYGNAAFEAGAVHAWNNADFDAANSVFVGNRATSTAGAIAVYGGDLKLQNATLVSNVATVIVGGVWLANAATANVVNTIFWNNRDQLGTNQFISHLDWATGVATPNVTYSNMPQGPQAFGITNQATNPLFQALPNIGPDNIWGTPDDNYGLLRLTEFSPLTDAGNFTALGFGSTMFDAQSVPRRFDNPAVANTGIPTTNPIDIGAYEYHPSGNCYDIQTATCAVVLAPLCTGGGDLFYGNDFGCPTGLFVDRLAPGGGNGSLQAPYQQVTTALNVAPAWAVISVIRGGNYPQTLQINQPVRIVNSGNTGDVRLGAE